MNPRNRNEVFMTNSSLLTIYWLGVSYSIPEIERILS